MTCPQCGNPKDKSEAYKQGDVNKPVTDAARLAEANAGPNWPCTFCKFDNRALRPTCQQCGASRERFQETPDDPEKRWPFPKKPPMESVNTNYRQAPVYRAKPPSPPTVTKKVVPPDFEEPTPKFSRRPSKGLLGAFLAFVGVISVAGFFLWFFMPHEHSATVQSIHWEYTRELQTRVTLHGDGWGHPGDAFNVSCETRQHGTESCHPHNCNPHQVGHNCNGHDCNCHSSCHDEGNGYSSCSEHCSTCYDTCYSTEYDTCYDQCPVYDDWCEYDYYQWNHTDTEVTSGNTAEVYWGTRLVANPAIPQRIVSTSAYSVLFVEGPDKQWTYTPGTLDDFIQYVPGAEWDVKTNYAGMIWPQHKM
jgi:hypothetical protein